LAVVLVVDDHAESCQMMARLVQACGHVGVGVTSGEAALAYLREHEVGLVILDNMMPGMDGMEVLRRMRADAVAAKVPVVVWSALADPNFREHALRKGARQFWLKATFDYRDLPRMLDSTLHGDP
jgi:CheY-like chemotaxis protein